MGKYKELLSKFQQKGYKNNRWLERYFYFIDKFKLNEYSKFETENHHILPQAIFPEYSNLSENNWNKCILSVRSHIICHYILARAIGGKMWSPLLFYCKKYNFNSKILSEIYKENRKISSTIHKGMVSAFDIKSNTYIKVPKEEFYTNNNYVGVNNGRKDIGIKISKSLNIIQDNGKTVAENRGRCGEDNPMFGMTGNKNPFYGKKHSDETKKTISEKAKKRGCHSDEHKRKISEGGKGHKKKNKENYIKYTYLILKDGKEIFKDNDQRNIEIFLRKMDNYPSLWKLKKENNNYLGFEFRKELKS